MPSEFINVAGTLIVAVVAGAISYAAGRGMKTHEWKLLLVKEQIASRKKLYVEFLAEADRLLSQSIERKVASVVELNDLNAKYAEICLLSSEPVIESAKLVVDATLTAHTAGPEKEDNDFYGRRQSFIHAARRELASYEKT